MKVSVHTQKATSEIRRPLQESSKQNIVAPPAEGANPLKGAKSTMQLEQVSSNHFKFIEENKPLDDMLDSMEVMEEVLETENSTMAALMQEDEEMGVEIAIQFQTG